MLFPHSAPSKATYTLCTFWNGLSYVLTISRGGCFASTGRWALPSIRLGFCFFQAELEKPAEPAPLESSLKLVQPFHFHGLCLFFGCVTLMIQILQVSSAWWMLRARPMSQWWRNEQVIVKIRYMGRREWCCSRTAGWLAGVTFGCRKEIWVKGLKEIRGSFPYVTQVWRQVVKRWCGGAMMSAGVLPSSSTCLSQARAESCGPLQLNSEDRNIW